MWDIYHQNTGNMERGQKGWQRKRQLPQEDAVLLCDNNWVEVTVVENTEETIQN